MALLLTFVFPGAAAAADRPGGLPSSSTRDARAAHTTTTRRADAERCIVPASAFHGVHPKLLRAILQVESGLDPNAMGRNRNGSVDIGIGQINSLHLEELARHGIAPGHLLDACIGTYVAAWRLRRQIERHGNTWFGVATYHSATPRHNARYQLLLYQALKHTRD